MKISYAITCYNEIEETKRLLKFLVKHSREQDEIVVFWDNNGPEELRNFLEEFYNSNPINFYAITFNKNFSELKNSLKKECNGDYIFQIDADEMLTEEFINQLPDILETNSNVEMFRVPRVNTVEGITQHHIQQWRWNISELSGFESEKEFDLANPQDLDEYNLLKAYNLIIEENEIKS